MSGSIQVINHPVINHKLSLLRDKETKSIEFRKLIDQMSALMAYEAGKDLTVIAKKIETPFGVAESFCLATQPVVVPIMRAGLGMLDGVLSIYPEASVGHIGMYRDRVIDTTVEYYFRLPDQVAQRDFLLLDPVLATGDTALASIKRLKQFNVGHISILTLLISKTSAERISHFYPEVNVYTTVIEDQLDSHGFLTPGIGDVVDRLYNIHSSGISRAE